MIVKWRDEFGAGLRAEQSMQHPPDFGIGVHRRHQHAIFTCRDEISRRAHIALDARAEILATMDGEGHDMPCGVAGE